MRCAKKALSENSYHCAGCCMWNTLSVIQISITVDQAKEGKLSILAMFSAVISILTLVHFFPSSTLPLGVFAGRISFCAQQQNYVIFLEVFLKR